MRCAGRFKFFSELLEVLQNLNSTRSNFRIRLKAKLGQVFKLSMLLGQVCFNCRLEEAKRSVLG